MKEDDEAKTSFQTHQGHYEYKVMAYGLPRAPAAFQGIMNNIITKWLRKVVFGLRR
jgi:hypothetical protein